MGWWGFGPGLGMMENAVIGVRFWFPCVDGT